MRAVSVTSHTSDNPLHVSQVEAPHARPGEVLCRHRRRRCQSRRPPAAQGPAIPPPPVGPSGRASNARAPSAPWATACRRSAWATTCALSWAAERTRKQIAVPADLVLPVPAGLTSSSPRRPDGGRLHGVVELRRRRASTPGETLVIHGGSGGIGSFAIQIGKARACASSRPREALSAPRGASSWAPMSRWTTRRRTSWRPPKPSAAPT